MEQEIRYVQDGNKLITESEWLAKQRQINQQIKEKQARLDAECNSPSQVETRRRRATVLKYALRGESVTSIWQTMLVDRKDLKLDTVVEDLLEAMRDFHDKVIADATVDVKRHMAEVAAAEARQANRARRVGQ